MQRSNDPGGTMLSAPLFEETDPGPEHPSKQQDDELLAACARFHAIDAELDRLAAIDEDALVEQQSMALHDQWTRVLARIVALPAHNDEGELAKSAVLRKATTVVSGGEPPGPAH
jgi:hypothetical protein